MMTLLTVALVLNLVTPLVLYFGCKKQRKRMKSILGLNLASFFGIMVLMVVILSVGAVGAEPAAEAAAGVGDGMRYLAAALVTGLACIGAGIAVSSAASAAIGALSEDDTIMGKALIFVALAEGIALYGLLVSFMML